MPPAWRGRCEASGPALIEVHNRPEIALYLARRFPAVTLFLHNDPRGMRAAKNPAQRDVLRSQLAQVFAVSGWVAERFGPGPGISVLPNGVDFPALAPVERAQDILFRRPGRRRQGCGICSSRPARWRCRNCPAGRHA